MPIIQMKMLNMFYRESVIPMEGLNRLITSWEFLAAAEGIWERSTFLRLTPYTSFALANGMDDSVEFLKYSVPTSASPEFLEAEKLGTAYALELHGLQNYDWEEIDIADFLDTLQKSGRPQSHIEFLEYLISRILIHEPAKWWMIFWKTTLFGPPLLCVWGWSLGYVYRAVNGTWYLRLLKMTAVGVGLWPLSIIVFWWWNRPQPIPEFTPSL